MNLFDYVVPEKDEEFTTLLEHKNIKIMRIVSSEQIDPKTYIQDEDEWVVVLKGEAKMWIGGKTKLLRKGESLFIPAKTPHKVLKTQKGTLWLAVHIS